MCEITLPADKHDLASAKTIVAAGMTPAVVAQLPAIISWFEDYNWPVAKALLPLFRNAGVEVASVIESVLVGTDDVHKYWVLQVIVPVLSRDARRLLLPAITRAAKQPTPGELAEEVDIEAQALLASDTST